MKRLLACLLLGALIVAPGQAQERRGPPKGERGRPDGPGGPKRMRYANPSAALAADMAFNRLAQDKGQWTAFLATSAPEAEMFVPQRVLAQTWLKKRTNPQVSLKWSPQAVWASCDGQVAMTQGAWQGGDGKQGIYVSVWQRQPKKGDFRWILDIGSTMATPPEAPEIIQALVASCDGTDLPMTPEVPLQAGDDSKTAVSRDGSLRWTSVARADGSHRFVATMRTAEGAREIIHLVAQPGQ